MNHGNIGARFSVLKELLKCLAKPIKLFSQHFYLGITAVDPSEASRVCLYI
jgi:hypothetical protein